MAEYINYIDKSGNLLVDGFFIDGKELNDTEDKKIKIVYKSQDEMIFDPASRNYKIVSNIFGMCFKKLFAFNEWMDKITLCSEDGDSKFFFTKLNDKWNIANIENDKVNFLYDWNHILPILSDSDDHTDRFHERELFLVDECESIENVKSYKKVTYMDGKYKLSGESIDIYDVKEYKLKAENITLYILKTKYYNKNDKDKYDYLTIINDKGEIFLADDNILKLYLEEEGEDVHRGSSGSYGSYMLIIGDEKYILNCNTLFHSLSLVCEESKLMATPWDGYENRNAIILFTKNKAYAYDPNGTGENTLIELDNAEYLFDKQYLLYEYNDIGVIIDIAGGNFADDDANYIFSKDIVTRKIDDKNYRYDYLCNERYLLVDKSSYVTKQRKDGTPYKSREGDVNIYDLDSMEYVKVSDYNESWVFNLLNVEDSDEECITVIEKEKDKDGKEIKAYNVIDPTKTYPYDAQYYVGCDFEYYTNYILKNGYIDMDKDEEWAKSELVESGYILDEVRDLLSDSDYDDMTDLLSDINKSLNNREYFPFYDLIEDEDELYDMLKRSDGYLDVKEEIEKLMEKDEKQ